MTSKLLMIRIPEDWHVAIAAEAKKRGVPKSALIKETLSRSLKAKGHQLSEPPKWGGSRVETKLGKS